MSGVLQVVTDTVRRFEQPEYTGENRCRSCTILNSAIVGLLVLFVATLSIAGAGILLVIGVASILLRGYFVPGTPTLVRYIPDRIHAILSPKHAASGAVETSHVEMQEGKPSTDGELSPSIDIEDALKSADIVRDCADDDDLRLTDQYHAAWQARMDDLQDDAVAQEQLAQSLSIFPDEISFEETEKTWYVLIDGKHAGQWGSKAAFLADLSGDELLESNLENWDDLTPNDRTQILTALRSFLETCPLCGGDVVPEEEVRRSCCRKEQTAVTTACVECRAVLFEGISHNSTVMADSHQTSGI